MGTKRIDQKDNKGINATKRAEAPSLGPRPRMVMYVSKGRGPEPAVLKEERPSEKAYSRQLGE